MMTEREHSSLNVDTEYEGELVYVPIEEKANGVQGYAIVKFQPDLRRRLEIRLGTHLLLFIKIQKHGRHLDVELVQRHGSTLIQRYDFVEDCLGEREAQLPSDRRSR